MAPVWADKYGRRYDYPPTKEEIELNEKLKRAPRTLFKKEDKLFRPSTPSPLGLLQQKVGKVKTEEMSILPIGLPKIITKPNLNGDPCVDDLDTKTNDSPDIMKIILIGVTVGVILGVFK